LAPSTGSGFRL